MDSQDRSISHESGTWLAPIVTYSSERIISIKIKYGGNDPYIGQTNPIDPHSFSIPSYFSSGLPSPTIVMNDALFEFPANGTEIILGISGTQPTFAAFASHCYATVDEIAAMKRSVAAEAARQEQARIDQEKAAEQAKIAQEQAAEQARIAQAQAEEKARQEAALREEQNKQILPKMVAYLGLGPIPSCNKPYEASFDLEGTQGHRGIEVYPKEATVVINALGNVNPTFDLKGRKKNLDYFIVKPEDGPFYIDVDLAQTMLGEKFTKRAVLIYTPSIQAGDQHFALWGWIPIDSIRFCDK